MLMRDFGTERPSGLVACSTTGLLRSAFCQCARQAGRVVYSKSLLTGGRIRVLFGRDSSIVTDEEPSLLNKLAAGGAVE